MATFARLAAALAGALSPLTFALRSSDSTRTLVAALGWNITAIPAALSDLGEALIALHGSLTSLTATRAAVDAGEAAPRDEDDALAAVAADLAIVVEQFHALPGRLRAELPPDFVAATQMDEELQDRLIDRLLALELSQQAAVTYHLLRTAGIIEVTSEAEDPARFQPSFLRYRIHWARLLQLIDPASLFRDVYGWGTPTLDAARLFRELVPLSFALGMPAELRYATDAFTSRTSSNVDPNAAPIPQLWIPVLRADELTLFVVIAPLATAAAAPQGVAVAIVPSVAGDLEVPFGERLTLTVTASAQVGTGVALVIRPDGPPSAVLDMHAPMGTPLTSGKVKAALVWRGEESDPAAGPSAGNGTRLTARRLSIACGAEAANGDVDVVAEILVDEANLLIAPPEDDGLLASVIPADGLKASFSLGVRWSPDGLRFAGSAGLSKSVPLHRTIGPLEFVSLDLAIGTKDAALTMTAAVTVALALGPLTVVVEGLGLGVAFQAARGNLGPIDLDVRFARPTALGVSLDAGVVSGGGFIGYDPASGRYAGLLQLKIAEVSVLGFGILDTRLPGGAKGYALLIALRATFPAIQVGFGFALTGIGGIVALNRRVDVDALRAQLAAGSAGRILAPEDPIRNAPALFADLGTAFPVAPGVTVVGPTAQLTWAALVRFDIAVLIELPGPSRIVLLGSARAAIEAEGRAYLLLRVDVIGVLDFARRIAAFDAVLIDSHLMEILDLTGGALFRLSWGDQPYAVFTLGGFHPAYNPEPLVLPPSLTRIAMVHGTPKDRLYLRFEGYLAVTSTTQQLGASVEVVIQSGSFNIQGTLGFDALIRFEPFHFQVDIRASVRVRYKSRTLAGLTLIGSLDGPGPVTLRAKVCIELLFFDICFSDTFTLGSPVPPPVTTIASALAVLAAELNNPAALQSSGPADRHVLLRQPPASGRPVVSPVGQLVWMQRQAPLGVLLQRIGGAPLAAPQSVEATSEDATGPELDWFAPGSFADLTDDQALTRRGFERLSGGLRLGAPGVSDGPAVQRTLTMRQIRLPAKVTSATPATAFPLWLVAAGARALGGDVPRPASNRGTIAVADERWTVVDLASGELREGVSGAQAHQLAALSTTGVRRVAMVTADRVSNLVF